MCCGLDPALKNVRHLTQYGVADFEARVQPVLQKLRSVDHPPPASAGPSGDGAGGPAMMFAQPGVRGGQAHPAPLEDTPFAAAREPYSDGGGSESECGCVDYEKIVSGVTDEIDCKLSARVTDTIEALGHRIESKLALMISR